GDPRASGAIVGNVVQLSDVLDRGYRVRVRAHRFWFEVGFDGHVGFEREHAVVVGDGRFVFGVALDVGRPGCPEIVGLDHVTLDLREKRRRFVGEDDAFFHDRSIWASRRPPLTFQSMSNETCSPWPNRSSGRYFSTTRSSTASPKWRAVSS